MHPAAPCGVCPPRSVVGTLPSTAPSARPGGILLGRRPRGGPHIKGPGSWGPLQSPLPFLV